MTRHDKDSGRKGQRHRFGVMVDYTDGEHDLFDFCGDLSEGGLFLKTLTPMPVGTVITIRFKFPYDLSQFETKAKVQWTRKEDTKESPSGMGLLFVEQSDEDRKALAQHIQFCMKL